jgi:ribosomal protein S18 acetylase RimI-like enzyme
MIRALTLQDFDKWLDISREVEPLFGPMANSEEFRNGIKNCIENHNAFGIENEGENLAGIIALDRDNNEISWLAVGKNYRGNNYGEKLIQKAIDELSDNGDIFVQTFSEKVTEGRSARIIYERNGFRDFKESGKNPANIDTVIMVRKKDV